MDITELDRNFLQNSGICDTDKFFKAQDPPFLLNGVFYDKTLGRFLRMPSDISKKVSESVDILNTNTAGGRIRFSTDSGRIDIVAKYSELDRMPHMTLCGQAGFALCENTEKGEIFIGCAIPVFSDDKGFARTITISDADKKTRYYTLYFPLYNDLTDLYIGLEKDACIGKGMPYRDIPPVLYYGSSITQGGCANRADTCYQARICKSNNVDYINLGFSGAAKGETKMAEYISGIKCSVFVLDYDHNADNNLDLKRTHYEFFRIFREKQPLTPVVFVSKPDSRYYDKKISKANAERFKTIEETYKRAVEKGDKNVYLVNGRTFFGKEWGTCTVDGCHPTDLGFYFMAKKIGGVINKIIGKKAE